MGEDIVSISAKTGEGLDQLLAMIGKRLDTGFHRVTLSLPYDKGGVLDMLYRDAKVEKVEYGETIEVEAVCSEKTAGQVREFITGAGSPPRNSGRTETMAEYYIPAQDSETEFSEKRSRFIGPRLARGDGGGSQRKDR